MGMCCIAIFNKGIEYRCMIFVEAGNGPALLGMPDCEQLKLLNVNCQAIDDQHRKQQINRHSKIK